MSNNNSSYINGMINVSYTYSADESNPVVIRKERTLTNLINIPIINNTAGMIITKQAPRNAANNEVFTYTITVTNQTGSLQSNLSVTDNLPDQFNVLTDTIIVEKDNVILQNGINYSANIDNGILTISGVNTGELELNANEKLTIEVSGYASF